MKCSAALALCAAMHCGATSASSQTNAGITTWDNNAACMPDGTFVEAWTIYNESDTVYHGCWKDPQYGYWTMLKGYVDTENMENITWQYVDNETNATANCLRGWTYYDSDGWVLRPFVKTTLWGVKPWCALPVYRRQSSVPLSEGKTWAYCGTCVADGDNACATCVTDYAQHTEL